MKFGRIWWNMDSRQRRERLIPLIIIPVVNGRLETRKIQRKRGPCFGVVYGTRGLVLESRQE